MMYLLYDQMFDATSRGERMGKQERERERERERESLYNSTAQLDRTRAFVRSFIHSLTPCFVKVAITRMIRLIIL